MILKMNATTIDSVIIVVTRVLRWKKNEIICRSNIRVMMAKKMMIKRALLIVDVIITK